MNMSRKTNHSSDEASATELAENEVKSQSVVSDIPGENHTENSQNDSVEATPEAPTSSRARKKRHLGMFLVMLLLLVSLAAAAGYLMSESTDEPENSTVNSTQTPAPANKNTTDIVGLLTKVSEAHQGGAVLHDRAAPDHTVSGYDFAAQVTKEDSSNIVMAKSGITQQGLETSITKIEALLTQNGLSKSVQQVSEPYWGLVKYENDDTVCGISHNRPDTLVNEGAEIYVACALKGKYATAAEVQKPFYAAYRAANPDRQTQGVGYPRISDSRTTGYKWAETQLYMEGQPTGAAGLFYLAPGGTWTFFTGTQQTLPCSDYSYAVLKKGYLDKQCFTATNSSNFSYVRL